jgi:hypothetical protein
VQDAVHLAWLRRRQLRLVVVLVPDAADVDDSRHHQTSAGCPDSNGRAHSGDGSELGGDQRRAVSHEHAEVALAALRAVPRHGSVLAGSWDQTLRLLVSIADSTEQEQQQQQQH